MSCPQPSNSAEEQPQASEDGLTYVAFTNNSQFDAEVYLDNPQLDKTVFASVPAGAKDFRAAILPGSDTGTPFYIVYRIKIGSVTIPYFNTAFIKNQKIAEAMITPVGISRLTSSPTESSYLVIQNDSAEGIWLQQEDRTLYAIGKEEEETQKWILPQEDGVYEFTSPPELNNIYIIDNIRKTALPGINCEKGQIYTLRYDGKGAVLFSIAPFNMETANKIWTIPSGTSLGRFFTVGFFAPRKNPQDGYVLLGNINYAGDTVTNANIQRPSYFSTISQNGVVDHEKTIYVKDDPTRMFFKQFIEESANELVFLGDVYYRTTEREHVFLLSMDAAGMSTNYYYTDFVKDIDEDQQDLYSGVIVNTGQGKYGVALALWDRQNNLANIYLANVNKKAFDEVGHTKLWASPPEYDIEPADMIYDASHNMYILLSHQYQTGTEEITGSIIFFIDADLGTEKFNRIIQNKFILNKILKTGPDYYVGGFYNNASGNYEGILHKINPSTGSFVWNDPVRFFSLDGSGSLSVKNLLEDDGKLILAGHTNASRGKGKGCLPWLCAFNPDRKEKIWENVYTELPDYEIFSVYPNGIGSYLIELYNNENLTSFLLSTDLMGKMSDNTLPAVPRDPKQTVAVPKFTLTFHANTEDGYDPLPADPPSMEVEYGKTIDPLPKPDPSWYYAYTSYGILHFKGWHYTDENWQHQPFTNTTPVTQDYDLWAEWEQRRETDPWAEWEQRPPSRQAGP
jgi:hypothetical protein